MKDVPQHRTAFNPRSGDTHVIGDDGTARNVDQEARQAETKAQAAQSVRAASRPKKAD